MISLPSKPRHITRNSNEQPVKVSHCSKCTE